MIFSWSILVDSSWFVFFSCPSQVSAEPSRSRKEIDCVSPQPHPVEFWLIQLTMRGYNHLACDFDEPKNTESVEI